MCNDIPGNRLHEKTFRITQNSPTSIAHQHLFVACFGELTAANPNRPAAQLRFQRYTWQNWGYIQGCVGSRSAKKLEL